MARPAMKYKNISLPRQSGELGRLRVLSGPDAGSVYVIFSNRVSVGRGEENAVVLTDMKASRKHVELSVVPTGAQFKDIGSSHGIMVNGTPQKQGAVRSGDRLVVGESLLEYVAGDPSSVALLQSVPKLISIPTSPAIISKNNSISPYRIASGNSGTRTNLQNKKSESFLEKNKRGLLIFVGLIAAAMMLPQVEEKQKKKQSAKYSDPLDVEAYRSWTATDTSIFDPAMVKRSEAHFREAFREYQGKNFLRAQSGFETALQVYPEHSLAKVYLESTKKEMEKEAKDHFSIAKRDEEANRFRDAQLHYDAVKRLYAKDQQNELYKQAETKIIELQKRIESGGR